MIPIPNFHDEVHKPQEKVEVKKDIQVNSPKIFDALLKVNKDLEEIGGIPFTGKSFFKEKNQGGGELKSRSIEDAVNSLRPLFIKNKIIHYCESMEMMPCDKKTRLLFTYVFRHTEDGSELRLKSIGESRDSNDTCIQSANSYALKNSLLNLVLMTGRTFEEDDVVDDTTHQQKTNHSNNQSNTNTSEYKTESAGTSEKYNNRRFFLKKDLDKLYTEHDVVNFYEKEKKYINGLAEVYRSEVLGWFSARRQALTVNS